MCEHGDTIDIKVPIIAALSHTGNARIALKPIDRCLAPIIKALLDGGLRTTGCCCGHGKQMGFIGLDNGMYLGVFPNRSTMMRRIHIDL